MELYNHLPPHLRDQFAGTIKGQRIVKFPAGYFRKAPQAMHIKWQNAARMDEKGNCYKTAPNFLIDALIKYLERMEVEFEVINGI